MLEAVIGFLIWACIFALVVYLVVWVLRDVIGVPMPEKVIQILWVIFALVCILFLVKLVLPMSGRVFGSVVMPMLI